MLVDFLIDVRFTDEQRGLAVGGSKAGKAVVIGTEDGGKTWAIRHESAASQEWGWKLSFPSPDTGYVSVEVGFVPGSDGKVLKTTDGGRTWADVLIPGGSALQGVGFATPRLGWTSGRGVRSQTTDGGRTWSRYTGGIDGAVNRFRMFGDTLGYAFGRGIYKYDRVATAVEQLMPALTDAPTLTVYPNPSSHRISFAFRLLEPGPVDLRVFDLAGREVAVVVREAFSAGPHVVEWGAVPGGPPSLPTGTYLYRLTTNAGVDAGPMIWVRR